MSNISKAIELDKRKDWAYIWNADMKRQKWLDTACHRLADAYPSYEAFVAAFLVAHPDADVYDEAFANIAICWGFAVLALDKVWSTLGKDYDQPLCISVDNAKSYVEVSFWDSGRDAFVCMHIKPYGPISQFNSYDSVQKFKNGALMEIGIHGTKGVQDDDKIIPAREFFSGADKCAKELRELAQKAIDAAID